MILDHYWPWYQVLCSQVYLPYQTMCHLLTLPSTMLEVKSIILTVQCCEEPVIGLEDQDQHLEEEPSETGETLKQRDSWSSLLHVPRSGERRYDSSPYSDRSYYSSSLVTSYLSPPPESRWRRTSSDSALYQKLNNPQSPAAAKSPSEGGSPDYCSSQGEDVKPPPALLQSLLQEDHLHTVKEEPGVIINGGSSSHYHSGSSSPVSPLYTPQSFQQQQQQHHHHHQQNNLEEKFEKFRLDCPPPRFQDSLQHNPGTPTTGDDMIEDIVEEEMYGDGNNCISVDDHCFRSNLAAHPRLHITRHLHPGLVTRLQRQDSGGGLCWAERGSGAHWWSASGHSHQLSHLRRSSRGGTVQDELLALHQLTSASSQSMCPAKQMLHFPQQFLWLTSTNLTFPCDLYKRRIMRTMTRWQEHFNVEVYVSF